MSNVFQLFNRGGAFVVFFLLEFLCFFLLVQNNEHQGEVFEATRLAYVGKWMEASENTRDFFRLKQLNQQLRDQNAALLSQVHNTTYDQETIIDSTALGQAPKRFRYVAAEVINKSPLSGNIRYVINRGRIQGIQPHSGVINENGVVGVVTDVADYHAEVMGLANSNMRLSAGLRGRNFFGSLRWEGGDARYATLYNIPRYAQMEIGDTVETTGYSNLFPQGVLVGVVEEQEIIKGDYSWALTVRLSNDFFRLKNAYVLMDDIRDDLEQLPQNQRNE
ncbi:MAG: rod shape-determining protein MreC [Bacteroidota bacterium]